MPRDRFSSDVRRRLQALLLERFGGDTVDYHLSLGDADAAHLFFSVHNGRSALRPVLARVAPGRGARRLSHVGRRSGRADPRRVRRGAGRRARRVLREALPRLLQDGDAPDLATLHVGLLERVRSGEPFAVGLQNEQAHQTHEGADPLTRLVVAKLGGKMPLSSLLPLLEGLD